MAPNPANPHEQRVYKFLEEWGLLKGETWFLDGGVLDNKPFSYTMREIFNRAALKPVDRKLLYVEPDPERFTAEKPARTEAPNVVQAAMQALLGIPGYESIADDLEQVVQRNDRIGRLVTARQAAQSSARYAQADGCRYCSRDPLRRWPRCTGTRACRSSPTARCLA